MYKADLYLHFAGHWIMKLCDFF